MPNVQSSIRYKEMLPFRHHHASGSKEWSASNHQCSAHQWKVTKSKHPRHCRYKTHEKSCVHIDRLNNDTYTFQAMMVPLNHWPHRNIKKMQVKYGFSHATRSTSARFKRALPLPKPSENRDRQKAAWHPFLGFSKKLGADFHFDHNNRSIFSIARINWSVPTTSHGAKSPSQVPPNVLMA